MGKKRKKERKGKNQLYQNIKTIVSKHQNNLKTISHKIKMMTAKQRYYMKNKEIIIGKVKAKRLGEKIYIVQRNQSIQNRIIYTVQSTE